MTSFKQWGVAERSTATPQGVPLNSEALAERSTNNSINGTAQDQICNSRWVKTFRLEPYALRRIYLA